MDKTVLYIIAAGTSSRMNGMPKHLCEINGIPNLEITINTAYKFFDKIVVVVNKDLSEENYQKTSKICEQFDKCEVIKITSGQGDLHAIVSSISMTQLYDWETFCVWGDTVFINESVFWKMDYISNMEEMPDNCAVEVYACESKDPYAYLTIDNLSNRIIQSAGFKSDSNYNNIHGQKYHDQSAFRLNVHLFLILFSTYMACTISKIDELKEFTKVKDIKIEYSIIRFIDFCAKNHLANNTIETVLPGSTMSFNTFDELAKINITI